MKGNPSLETRRILVVDDEPDLTDLLKLVLAGPGREVVVSSNGTDCLQEAEEDPPSLVILDVHLRDYHAFDLLPKLRALPGMKTKPIVLLSGSPLDDLELEQLAEGGVEVFQKPVPLRKLKARVDALLEVLPGEVQ